jgi:hypothetical protein
MFYFTKRSTRLAFSGLSEMFSISRNTALKDTTTHKCTTAQHRTTKQAYNGHQQFGIYYQASLGTSFLSFV